MNNLKETSQVKYVQLFIHTVVLMSLEVHGLFVFLIITYSLVILKSNCVYKVKLASFSLRGLVQFRVLHRTTFCLQTL